MVKEHSCSCSWNLHYCHLYCQPWFYLSFTLFPEAGKSGFTAEQGPGSATRNTHQKPPLRVDTCGDTADPSLRSYHLDILPLKHVHFFKVPSNGFKACRCQRPGVNIVQLIQHCGCKLTP